MADRPSTSTEFQTKRILNLENEAHSLVERMPDLIMETERIAATVAHGIHGRRRAGQGETFWQFRPYETYEGAHRVDWRRSASSDQLFVREHEWEAAHTLYLWPNLSPSMRFRSHLAPVQKAERALVLSLCAAEILVRAGERVALLGAMPPTASRRATQKMAEAIISAPQFLDSSHPPTANLSRFSTVVLFSDFLEPFDDVRKMIESLGSAGANGHLVQVLDPAEETLPYSGRTEFLSPDGNQRWIAERVESVRAEYQKKLQDHRAAIKEVAHRLGWSFLVHHTDRPATEPLLALMMHLEGTAGAHRWMAAGASADESESQRP